MDIVSFGTKLVASEAKKKIWSMLPSAQTNELYRKILDDLTLEFGGFLEKLVERMGGDHEQALQRLADCLTEKEGAALVGRLIPEAVFSATEDRRRLMAAAMAGSFSPDFEVEEKSRLTRAVAQLEPSDVLVLRGLGRASPFGTNTIKRLQAARAKELSVAALVAAGCVVEVVVEHMQTAKQSRTGLARPERRQHQLTELGSMTLKFIADWSPSAEGPADQ